MSDEADQLDPILAKAIEDRIAHVRRQPTLQADGRCHFCDETTPPAVVFCDVHCRDDYEREQAALQRAGRRT